MSKIFISAVFTAFGVTAPTLLGQIALVHATPCGSGAFPATACTIPATGTGNLIVVAWTSVWGTVPVVSSITDNVGNSYSEAGGARSVISTSDMIDIWYAKNSTAGATTLTITPNPSGNTGAAVIWEFSGVDTVSPLDQTSVLNNQPASSTPFGASVTTTSPAEVIISTMLPAGSITGILSGNPFTSDFTLFGTGWGHLITSSTGTYTSQWSTSNGSYASSTVSFKGISSGTPLNSCDLAAPFGSITAADVQAAINMTLGVAPCTANLVGSGVCNIEVVQRVTNAALGQSCMVSTGLHVVAINWTASTSSGVVGYNIYRGTASGGPYTKIGSVGTTTTYTDTTVVSGTTYYYVVAAFDGSNNVSPYSTQVSAAIPVP